MKSLDQFRRLEVREKVRNVFVMSLRLSDHKVLHNISISLGFARFFHSYFVLSKLLEFKEFDKKIFHSLLLDIRLVIANSDHLISNVRSWNNC